MMAEGFVKSDQNEAPRPTCNRIERHNSDSSESNSGWETGDDDDASTDLDLTDHSTEQEFLFDWEKTKTCTEKANPRLAFMSRKSSIKLKNPWKQSSHTNKSKSMMTTKPTKFQMPRKTNRFSEKGELDHTQHQAPKSYSRYLVRRASQKGLEFLQNATNEMARSASKRFSSSRREKAALKPGNEKQDESADPSKNCHAKKKKHNTEKKKRVKKGTKKESRESGIPKKDKVFVEPLNTVRKALSTSNALDVPTSAPDKRRAPHRVPSQLVRLWQRRHDESVAMVLQWASWEYQVQQMVKTPALQPWASFKVKKNS